MARQDAAGSFDLLGTGHAIKSGWAGADDGLLAVDTNGNGKIDDISELFGGTAKGAGYAKLGSYDSNSDGVVNQLDVDFGKLLVWQDKDGDRQTDQGELVTLTQAGIASLSLHLANQSFFLDAQGNVHGETSSATLTNGQIVTMTDVYFNVAAKDAEQAGVPLPTLAELLGIEQPTAEIAVLGSSMHNPYDGFLA